MRFENLMRHDLFADAFRPFFALIPLYVLLSVPLWGAFWMGWFPLPFRDPLAWHSYEMVYGLGSAAMVAFILTLVPELYPEVRPVAGARLVGLAALWIAGRAAFWAMDLLGPLAVALVHLPLLAWTLALVAPPLLRCPLKRQRSFVYLFALILALQAGYFAAALGWLPAAPAEVLKLALGAFMVLILIALRRINTEAVNRFLNACGQPDAFLARPPRYNLAIFTVALYTAAAFLLPGNAVLAWLALAAGAAILGVLNDFFTLDERALALRPFVLSLMLIPTLMALGYGMLGYAHLMELPLQGQYLHLLTLGALGLAIFLVMVIAGALHTGREIEYGGVLFTGALLIAVAALLRGFVLHIDAAHLRELHLAASLLWSGAFLLYLRIYLPFLLNPPGSGGRRALEPT